MRKNREVLTILLLIAFLVSITGCQLGGKAKLEENLAIARIWNLEIWNKGSLDAVDQLCAENFTFNYPLPGCSSDREGYKTTLTNYKKAFEGLSCEIIESIADVNKVAVRWKCTSTHKGPFMGIAPTGKELTTTGISILTIENAKITEEYTESDMLSMFMQLGMFPIQGQPAADAEAAPDEIEK
ncbi:ester cyclase [bacterium]|nr:ester cyclase [bacterium]